MLSQQDGISSIPQKLESWALWTNMGKYWCINWKSKIKLCAYNGWNDLKLCRHAQKNKIIIKWVDYSL